MPLAIDLYCGLGGWTEGLLAEGYRVVGFDIERHVYGEARYPAQLVLQDILTMHGRQLKDAALIVASPPCQKYSYMAMPWTKAKALIEHYRQHADARAELTALFDACFRIQREASDAAGRHIPLVVENVRGAQPWVGRAKWHFGSFYLWGDVPALMPIAKRGRMKFPAPCGPRMWSEREYDGNASAFHQESGTKVATMGAGWYPPDHLKHVRGLAFNSHAERAIKGENGGWFNDAKRNGGTETGYLSRSGSKSTARKAASAHIAKIPLVLARHIARVYHPRNA